MGPAATAPRAFGELRAHLAGLTDLVGTMAVLGWDQNTNMPPGGAETRANQLASLERIAHERLIDPALGRLLDALEPWAAEQDPDSDEACLVRLVRRDHDKATRVPTALAEEMARESAVGYADWLEACAGGGFARCRDAYARHLELRMRYAACFPEAEHPYDVLLDDYEPWMTLAELRPLFGSLVGDLLPLVDAAAASPADAEGGVLLGRFPLDDQHAALVAILRDLGMDAATWRLDTSPHPFAQSPGPGDYRITTRYREDDLGYSLYSALHEFGHGLYDAGYGAALRRTPLHECASLGVHESQSRLWENIVGRSRPFCGWLLGRLQVLLPGHFDAISAHDLFRGVNVVARTPIRTEADETTYNLHIALRLELELAMIEGRLAVDDLPSAWREGMQRLLGVEVASDEEGVLQDVHWPSGAYGYFPTYTIGNLMSAQIWRRARQDLPDIDDAIARGDFAPLREWLRDNVHVHGRKYPPRELLRRVTGEELGTEALLEYLRAKLAAAGHI